MPAQLLNALALAVLSVAQWTTISNHPIAGSTLAAGHEDAVYFVSNSVSGNGHFFSYTILLDTWSTLWPCPTARDGAALASLSTNQVIVTGGDTPTIMLATTEIYNAATGTWTTGKALPFATAWHVSVGYDDKASALNGYITSPLTHYVYNMPTDTWTLRRSPPVFREDTAAAYVDGFILESSGYMNQPSDLYVYTVATDTWTAGTSYPSPHLTLMGQAGAASGFYFVVGGYTFPGGLTSPAHKKFEALNVAADLWTTLSDCPVAISGSGVGVVTAGRGRLVVAALTGTFMYDPEELFVTPMWTTVTACPRYFLFGGGAVVGGAGTDQAILYTNGYASYKYFPRTDTWTTLEASAPIIYAWTAIGPVSPTSVLVVGGYTAPPPTPPTCYSDVFELSHDGTWTTRTPIPTAHGGMAFAFDGGNTAWLLGGFYLPLFSYSETMWAHSISTDAWTTKKSVPLRRYGSQTAYMDGRVVSIGGINPGDPSGAFATLLYTVAQDTWTTASPSPTKRFGTRTAVAYENYVFTIGATPPSEHTQMLRYNILDDEWSLIQRAPRSGFYGTLMVLPTGVIVLVGRRSTHVYWSGLFAKLVGDPEVTSFTGVVRQLSLWPGVFNLVTTASVVVNAVIEEVPTLPPDENLVVTMVGVVAVLPSDSLVTLDCVASQSGFLCNENLDQPASSWRSDVSIASFSETGFIVTLANFTVEVHFRRRALLTTVAPGVVEAFPTSSWLDVVIRSHASVLETGAVGLLAPSSDNELGDYEVAGGCLFALDTPASAGVFTLSDGIPPLR